MHAVDLCYSLLSSICACVFVPYVLCLLFVYVCVCVCLFLYVLCLPPSHLSSLFLALGRVCMSQHFVCNLKEHQLIVLCHLV